MSTNENSNLPIPSVSLTDGRPATTSIKIAECFGKRHCDVMRDIQKLIKDCPVDFSERNFALAEYMDEQGKPRPMYTVFFDGFTLLVMGYTGKKALDMKLAYIGALNAMREKLENQKAKKLVGGQQSSLPEKSKYEAFLEAVENLRSRTAADIEALLHEGLNLVDVGKLGPGAIIGFTPVLLDWLQSVVGRPSPIINPREPLDRAIEYSPLYLIKHLERRLPDSKR